MYTETMNELQTTTKGYAQQLSKNEVKIISLGTNYRPHHGLTNINKPNRIRVVFIEAAAYSETSMNQNLLKGLDFLSSLIGVLMKFQEGQFAILRGIEAMFLKEDFERRY